MAKGDADFKIQLIPKEKLHTILPLVSLLNHGNIEYAVLEERLKDIIAMGGYECIGVYDDEELIGICGIWILNKFYAGKHIEPDNVYIKEAYRSQGIGELMMNWMLDYARKIGCIGSEVNCYVKNEKAGKFYERHGYEPLAYHYFKTFEK